MIGKNCVGCRAEMDSDAIFCNECGMAQPAAVSEPPASVNFATAPPRSVHTGGSMQSSNPFTSSSFKSCPKCGKQADASIKFCSGCAFDFSAARPESVSVNNVAGASGAYSFPPELVLAVKRRYKDGYLYARFFNGVGAFIKALGLIIGTIIAIAGFIIGGGIADQSRNSLFGGPGAGVGFGVGFVFVLYAAILTAFFWIVGVIVKAGAQMLKASLDNAVHSSPFLDDMDRALIMSLPVGKTEKKTSNSTSLSGGADEDETQRLMAPNVKASLAYGGSFIFGIFWLPVPIFLLATTGSTERLVRFHAFQSIMLIVALSITGYLLSYGMAVLWGPGSAASVAILLGSAGLLLFCLWKAYNKEEFKLPVIGNFAMGFAEKDEASVSF